MRVIRRLACDMSPVQLGQDPTIRILSNTEAAFWQERANEMEMQSFPTYAVTMGIGNRCWYTLGPPIWSSLSLLGRGTAIWRVCDSAKPDKLLVLKNAWRSSERLAESTIYQAIRGVHPGVAEYEFGADVVFPDNGRPISVHNLRDNSSSSSTASTPILHRLFISTIGRPLWDYNSDLELLSGIRSALKGSLLPLYVTLCRLGKSIGHHFLYDQGILHRDVSAGNILLSSERNPQPGREGFIMDVEYAHITRPSLNAVTTTNVAPVRGPGGDHDNADDQNSLFLCSIELREPPNLWRTRFSRQSIKINRSPRILTTILSHLSGFCATASVDGGSQVRGKWLKPVTSNSPTSFTIILAA